MQGRLDPALACARPSPCWRWLALVVVERPTTTFRVPPPPLLLGRKKTRPDGSEGRRLEVSPMRACLPLSPARPGLRKDSKGRPTTMDVAGG
jgi:hypothetical protein